MNLFAEHWLWFSVLQYVFFTSHVLLRVHQEHLRANNGSRSLSQTSNSAQCKQPLCSLSGGCSQRPFEECFRAKRKKRQGTSNKTEGTAGVDPALSRLQSCVNAYKSTLQIQRDTRVAGLRPPRPYRPPHKH